MSKAGYCAQCASYVWLTGDGGCVNGHEASQISNVYEPRDKIQETASEAADALDKVAGQAADALKGLLGKKE